MAIDLLKVPDLIECSICTEEFRRPKMLPCQHVFCLQCLDNMTRSHRPAGNMIDSSVNDNGSKDSASCPLCRTQFSVPGGGCGALPNSLSVTKLIDALETDRKNGQQQQQQQPLNNTQAMISTSTDDERIQRNQVPAAEEVDRCWIHPQRTLGYFCTETQCRVPVCSQCLQQAHDGHKHRSIADAVAASRSRIGKLTADARARLATSAQLVQSVRNARERLNGSAADAVEQIRQHAEFLHAEIDRVKEELLRDVDDQLSSLTTKYDECDRRLLTTMLDLRNVEQTCRQLRNNINDVDVVRQTAVCEDNVDRLYRNPVELPDIASIRYYPGPAFDEDQVTQFGAVHVVQSRKDEDERQVEKMQQRQSPTLRCPRPEVAFDPKCGVVVHGLVADPDVADTDVFQDMCSEYFHFRPTIVSPLCRRLRWRWRRAPLLIVCENEADARRVVNEAKHSSFRSATGIAVVRYSLSK